MLGSDRKNHFVSLLPPVFGLSTSRACPASGPSAQAALTTTRPEGATNVSSNVSPEVVPLGREGGDPKL